ncbi:hypothetical protein DFH09DRAFT_1079225 [Mycena vulgaris]|nr:hypothetical protein DFH09DRAFT_1079225 [Mycena vulgaris]
MSMLVGLETCRNVAEGFIRGGQPVNTRFKEGLDHPRMAILCCVEAGRRATAVQHSVDEGRTAGGWGDDGGGKESTLTLDESVPIEEPLEVELDKDEATRDNGTGARQEPRSSAMKIEGEALNGRKLPLLRCQRAGPEISLVLTIPTNKSWVSWKISNIQREESLTYLGVPDERADSTPILSRLSLHWSRSEMDDRAAAVAREQLQKKECGVETGDDQRVWQISRRCRSVEQILAHLWAESAER